MKKLAFSLTLCILSLAGFAQALYETTFEGAYVENYKIVNTDLGCSTWGREGSVTPRGFRAYLDVDTYGTPPSGNGNLAYRCEAVWPNRILEKPIGTRMKVIVPSDWKPDVKENPEILIQLHGTGVPNLSIRVREDRLYADIRYLSPDWKTATLSPKIPFGPGEYVIEIEWLATKGNHGYFKVWINGDHLITHNGPTMYQDEAKSGLKHQFGLYKDDWSSGVNRDLSRNIGVTDREYFVSYFGAFPDSLPDENTPPPAPNQKPVAQFTATPTLGFAPLAVNFDASKSTDPDGVITQYAWDFGDGSTANGKTTSHTYTDPGLFNAILTVRDDSGATHSVNMQIEVQGVAEPCALSGDWQETDIGDVAVPGSACVDSDGIFTISGSGADIWNTADAFHFVYQPMGKTAEIVMRVNSLTHTHDYAKSGIMIRESMDPGSVNAMIYYSGWGRWSFQHRATPNGLTVSNKSTNTTPYPLPFWFKLSRQDNVFRAYFSLDGVKWTYIDQITMAMAPEAYVGMAVTSHDNTVATNSTVDNVSLTTNGTISFPVELLDFQGFVRGESVVLEWETSSELNNAYYTIEKSQDGTLYNVLDEVDGAGTSQSTTRYHLIDDNPQEGVIYYRLKQTDFDGTYQYLGTVEINFEKFFNPGLDMYPNPNLTGELNLELTGVDPVRINGLKMLDATGRVVWIAREIKRKMQIRLPDSLPPGIYTVLYDYGAGIIGERLVIR